MLVWFDTGPHILNKRGTLLEGLSSLTVVGNGCPPGTGVALARHSRRIALIAAWR